MSFKDINRCDLYVLIWGIYMMQGVLYPSGIINVALQFVLLAWALCVSLRYFLSFRENPALLNITSLLVFMYIVYGGLYMLFGERFVIVDLDTSPSLYVYLQTALNSLLPIYLFYDYSKRRYLTEKRINFYFILFVLIYIVLFYKNYNDMLINAALEGVDRDEFTNNTGYSFLTLFPFLYFWRKQTIIQYVSVLILLIFILMGMKRGAIMIAAICFVLFLYHNWRESERSKGKFMIMLLSLAIVSGIVYYVEMMLETNDYFMYRIEQTLEGDSSGRNIIYSKIKNVILEEPSSLKLIFGHGANSTISFAGNYAHQDWLEIACNNGLLGVVIFALFFIIYYIAVIKSKRVCPRYIYNAFFILFFISLSKTMFSMSIQNLAISQTLLIGYFLYKSDRKAII